MTVRELIAQLLLHDPDLLVVAPNDLSYFAGITEVAPATQGYLENQYLRERPVIAILTGEAP